MIGNGSNRLATLYVEDAARAALLAGTQPAAAGRIYDVASDEPVTQRQLLDATTDALGLPRVRDHVGRRVAMAAAWAVEMWSCLLRREPAFNRAVVSLVSTDHVLDTRPIRQDLEWRAEMSFDEGMRRMGRWYAESRT